MAAGTGLATLPGRLVDRMTARRGRSYAFSRLVPPATALVVIDMTRIFLSERPEAAAITAAINRLGRTLRSGGGSVFWVRPGPFKYPSLLGAVIGEEAAARQQSAAVGLSPDGRLWPALDVQPGDLHATKSLYSAFFPGASDVPMQLKARNIDTVVIAGALTDVCCEASARDAFSCGFHVIMLCDACIGSSPEAHANALAAVFRNFGDVRTSEEVIELLSAPR